MLYSSWPIHFWYDVFRREGLFIDKIFKGDPPPQAAEGTGFRVRAIIECERKIEHWPSPS
jgi:hypothetical protein